MRKFISTSVNSTAFLVRTFFKVLPYFRLKDIDNHRYVRFENLRNHCHFLFEIVDPLIYASAINSLGPYEMNAN